jgi:hypothetical protein
VLLRYGDVVAARRQGRCVEAGPEDGRRAAEAASVAPPSRFRDAGAAPPSAPEPKTIVMAGTMGMAILMASSCRFSF